MHAHSSRNIIMCSQTSGLTIRACEKPLMLEMYVLFYQQSHNYDTNFTQKIQIIKESNDIVNREQLVFGQGAILAA
jgi:hypothetical protein